MKEHQHIEWKESWRNEFLKWICGFANAEGGVLVIGRNDAGTAVGVKDAKKLRGIERIVPACTEANVPVPKFEGDSTGLWTIFRFAAVTPVETLVKTPVEAGSTTQETTQETSKTNGNWLYPSYRPHQGGHWEVSK